MRNEKIVIYTAQVGYVNTIRMSEPTPFTCDWIAFKCVAREKSRQLARRIKILGHTYLPEGYDIYIWLDSTERFIADVRPYVEAYLKDADWCALTELPEYGSNIYEGAIADVENGRTTAAVVEKQLARYKEEGVPLNAPLYQNSMLIRRKTPETIKICEAWWEEYNKAVDPEIGFGDQPCMAYIAWKYNINVNRLSHEERFTLIGGVPYDGSRDGILNNEDAIRG